MAYFVEQAQTGGTAGITAIAMNVPAHQTDDILVAHITVDSGTITVGGSGWAALPSAPANPVTSGTISYLYYFLATGSSSTLTLTTADAYTCGIYCFRDVDTTTPFDGVTPLHAAVGGATTTPVNSTVTTGTNDALVVFHIAQDGTTPQVLSDPGVMSIYNADSTGTTATTSSHQSAAWYIQRTAGATPVANWSSSVSAVYVRITYALRNKSGGAIPAYVDDVSSPGTRLTCGHHVATQNNISYSAAASFVVTANINGKTLTQGTAANGADFGINPYTNAVSTTAAQTAATAFTGPELVLTSGRNLSTGLICGSIIAGTPKMGSFGLGTISNGGVVVRVASGANNWNAYQVAAKNSVPNPGQRCVFAIQAGFATDYDTGSSGGATTTSVTYIQFLRNAPYFSSTIYMSELHQVFTQIIAGGDANNPVDTDGMNEVGQSFRLPVIQKVGAAGLISFVPIQIGGGDAVNFQIDAGSLQFPRRADTTKRELQYHAADNTLGISYAGKSGDVIKHTNSLVSSPTPFYWEINSAATSAATWDFTGLVIVGANVTLRNVGTSVFTSMSFSACPTIVASGCTVTSCTISGMPATNDTLTTSSTTVITSSTITTTTVTAGNRWVSVIIGDLDIFTNCAFIGSATSGHAIRISSTGTATFTGNTFTSYGPTVFSFHTTNDVTGGASDWVTKDSHGYANGDPIRYMKQGGSVDIGLTNDTTYYVRAVTSSTIAFYTSSANAIADTSRINLTSTGTETHYINSLGTAIFNDSGGEVTLNIAGGGTIPTIRNGASASTTVNVAVTVTVTAKDANTLDPIETARVLLEADSVATGTHTGSDNASTLTDGSQSFTTNALVNYRIYNTTDGSDGLITANTATTVTATLAGGTQNDWDTSDAYIIVAKPALNPVSITRSGSTATVTHRNHGLSSGTSVVIRGTTQDEYIGTYTISNVSTNAYDYTVTGTPATPATGSPTSTAVILSGTTNASGIIETTTFNYTIDQPVIGKARRATTGTLYKTGAIPGTITSTGLDVTVLLIVDE